MTSHVSVLAAVCAAAAENCGGMQSTSAGEHTSFFWLCMRVPGAAERFVSNFMTIDRTDDDLEGAERFDSLSSMIISRVQSSFLPLLSNAAQDCMNKGNDTIRVSVISRQQKLPAGYFHFTIGMMDPSLPDLPGAWPVLELPSEASIRNRRRGVRRLLLGYEDSRKQAASILFPDRFANQASFLALKRMCLIRTWLCYSRQSSSIPLSLSREWCLWLRRTATTWGRSCSQNTSGSTDPIHRPISS